MKKYLFFVIFVSFLFSCGSSTDPIYDPEKGFEFDFMPKNTQIGETVTLFCKNLPSYSYLWLRIGSKEVTLSGGYKQGNLTIIKFRIPYGAQTDNIVLHADRNYSVSKEKIVINSFPNPIVTGMNPPSGCPGTIITISGKGFLPYKKNMKVILKINSRDQICNLINITDNSAQFVLPDTTAMFDVYLKFFDGLVLPVTGTFQKVKLLVGKDKAITFAPQLSLVNDKIKIKMYYLGNSKPRVYFGSTEAQVTGFSPVVYEYRQEGLGPNGNKPYYYDGFIECLAPKVNGPCKIRVVTDCGELTSSLEYNNMDFRSCFAEVINLSATMKQYDNAFKEPKYFPKAFPYYTKTLDANHLVSFKDNTYSFFLNDVKSDKEGNYNGMRYSYKFNLIDRTAIIGFDYVSGSGAQHNTTTQSSSSYIVNVKNMKVIDTGSSLIYYLNGNDLINNISAHWNTSYSYRSSGMQRTVTEELVELLDFTDSTYVKLTINK